MIKRFLNYSGVVYLNQICNIFINVLLIKYVSLSVLGDVTIAKVWMRLIDYSHLGLRFSVDRYCPVWTEQQRRLLFVQTILVSTVVSFIVLCMSLLFSDNKFFNSFFILFGYAVSVFTILKNYFRAINEQDKMIVTFFFVPFIPSVTQALILFFLGFDYYLYSFIFFFLVCVIALIYICIYKFEIRRFSFKKMKYMFKKTYKNSSFLFANSLVLFFIFAIDRVLLKYYADSETVGEYSIILFGLSLLLIVPTSLSEFFYSKIVSNTVKNNQFFYKKEMLLTFMMTVFLVVIAFFISPIFFDIFIKEYVYLLDSFRLLLLGVIPYAFLPILSQVLVAADKEVLLIKSAVFLLVIDIIFLVSIVYVANDVLFGFVVVKTVLPFINLGLYFFMVKNLSGYQRGEVNAL
jgi:O-antigen/teichoic acid export membrane protein